MRFLLDENIEHEVYHRLGNHEHERLHVKVSDELSKGDTDERLAEVSRLGNWIIVTYDDDFRDDFTADEYRAVLYFADQTLSAKTVADIQTIRTMSPSVNSDTDYCSQLPVTTDPVPGDDR